MAELSHGVYQLTEHFGFGGLTGGFKAVEQGKNKLGLVIGSLVFLVWVAENQAGCPGFGQSLARGRRSGFTDKFYLTTDVSDGT